MRGGNNLKKKIQGKPKTKSKKEKNIFSILMFVSIGCIIIMGILVFVYFFSSNSDNNYGERLNGIDDVKIANPKLKEIEDNIKTEKNIQKSSIRLQGKIFHVTIYLSDDGGVNDGINASTKVLEHFSDEEKSFYDFSFIITKGDLTSEDKFPIFGYKNSVSKNISWTHNAS